MTDHKTFREDLRSRLSIVDVVSKRVPLKLRGKDFWGCCPFHNEKTASFSVNEDKGFYHCFGCGAHGDIINFETNANNLSYLEAIEKLAAMAGIPVPQWKPIDPVQQERALTYLKIMNSASELFSRILYTPDGRPGLDYLRERGFSDEIIRQFRIGYAPHGSVLTQSLKNFSDADLYASQLIRKSNNGPGNYDFFRNRIMFPITDENDRVIAFSGRAMNPDEPKYVNIAETEFFHKRRTLYGLASAKPAIRSRGRAIVVEGQIDTIMLQNAGFGETVAPLGTALTSDHLSRILKLTKQIIFCFDGDIAGQKAAARSLDIILPMLTSDHKISIMLLPNKSDPDEIIRREGPAGFEFLLSRATNLTDYIWALANQTYPSSGPSGRAQIEKYLVGQTNLIRDEILKKHINSTFKNLMFENWGHRAQQNKPAPKLHVPNAASGDEKMLTAIILTHPDLLDLHLEFLAGFKITNPTIQKIYMAALARTDANTKPIESEMLRAQSMTSHSANKTIMYLQMQNHLNALIEQRKNIIEMRLASDSDELKNAQSAVNDEIESIQQKLDRFDD